MVDNLFLNFVTKWPAALNILSHVAYNMPVNEFWAEISEQDISEYNSKGTVSYTAMNSARILGCSKEINS